MRISDLVGHTELASTMAQIGLVLALVGFVSMLIYALSRGNRATFDRARMLPLGEDRPLETDGTGGDDGGK